MHSINYVNSIQVVRKGVMIFSLQNIKQKLCIKSCKSSLKIFIASEKPRPLRQPLSEQGGSVKCKTDYIYKQYFACFNQQLKKHWAFKDFNAIQGCSQPHSPGWARVPLSSFFPQISIKFSYFSSNFYSFSSSFWPSGWESRPPGKALATPLMPFLNFLRQFASR